MLSRKVFLILCLPVFTVSALEPWQELFERFDYQGNTGYTMPYNVMKPIGYDSTKKYPLVLALHGMGGEGTDGRVHTGGEIKTWAQASVQAKYPCFVLAPQCPAISVETMWGDAHYEDVPAPMKEKPSLYGGMALAVVQLLQERYPSIDRNRTYICGGSMGAVGAFYLSQHRPDLFAAGIAVSGGGDDKRADSLFGMAFMAVHGTSDGIVPTEGSRAVFRALQNLGQNYLLVQNPASDPTADYSQHRYVYIENPQGYTSHGISGITYPMPQVQAWLFSKSRNNAVIVMPRLAPMRNRASSGTTAFMSSTGLWGGLHSGNALVYTVDGRLFAGADAPAWQMDKAPSCLKIFTPSSGH